MVHLCESQAQFCYARLCFVLSEIIFFSNSVIRSSQYCNVKMIIVYQYLGYKVHFFTKYELFVNLFTPFSRVMSNIGLSQTFNHVTVQPLDLHQIAQRIIDWYSGHVTSVSY